MEIISLERKASKRVASMYTRTFLHDPIARFIFPKATTYKRITWLESYCRTRSLIKRGVAYAISDYAGAALWLRPGSKREPSLWEILSSWTSIVLIAATFTISPAAHFRILRVNADMKKRMKKEIHEPHWVLDVLGVDPDYHGKGYGGALMRHMLARIDAEQMPAYVITHDENNIPFYEHFGFELIDKAPGMKGAPPTCSLRRPAQG